MVKIWWWWWSYCCLDSYVSCQSGPYFKGLFSKGVKTERTKNVPTSVLFTCMKWSVVAHLKISNHAGNSNLTMIPQSSTLTQTHQRPQICSTINHGFLLTHSASLGKLQFTQVLFFFKKKKWLDNALETKFRFWPILSDFAMVKYVDSPISLRKHLINFSGLDNGTF